MLRNSCHGKNINQLRNNECYGEIRERHRSRPEGVDLAAPDFCAIAQAYRLKAERAVNARELPAMIERATGHNEAKLIDVTVNEQFEF